jgi:hypothetical protein
MVTARDAAAHRLEDPDNVIEKTVTTLGQAQPWGLKGGPCARYAPMQTGRDHRDHRDHHKGNRLAAPLAYVPSFGAALNTHIR